MDIELTDRAKGRIREIAQNEQIDTGTTFLRVGVVSGGCSGLTYELGWDTVKGEKDREARVDDITVLMDLKSFLYIAGSTLDFTDGLEGQGFHFVNPQASRTCACGESFSL